MQGESLIPLLTGDEDRWTREKFIIITMNIHLFIWLKDIMVLLIKNLSGSILYDVDEWNFMTTK